MRIAFFSDNFYPELSGITDTIIMTGKELKKRGHEVCYIGPYYSPKNYLKAGLQYPNNNEDDAIDGMQIMRLPSLPVPFSPTGQSRFALPVGKSIQRLTAFKPDIIHTQSSYGVGLEALRVSRLLHVPLVGTNHTAVEDFFPLQSIMRAYDSWYYNHCEFVTTPYSGLITRMREKGFKKPARAVANPVELVAFTPTTPKERDEYKNSFGLLWPVILYVGRLGVEKNVDVILHAVALLVKKFPTLTFVITGHGAAEDRIKKLVQKLAIGRHVHFTGFLSRAMLPHVHKTADVFAMMSTSDSQSIALMQAYASGIPAVCARARGLPDYTPSDCGFLVEPGDCHALAEKLSLMLSDDALRERMGKAAAEYAKRFATGIIAKEWEGVYRDVLDKSRPQRFLTQR